MNLAPVSGLLNGMASVALLRDLLGVLRLMVVVVALEAARTSMCPVLWGHVPKWTFISRKALRRYTASVPCTASSTCCRLPMSDSRRCVR
jgi:hypothetical protein